MTVVKMPPVNVGSCVTAFMQYQRMAAREMGLMTTSWTAREEVGGNGRSIMSLCGHSISVNP